MKTLRLLTLTALISGTLLLGSSHATEVGNQRTVGLGVAIGDPTSLVGKVFVGAGQAIDFGIAFSNYGAGYGRCYKWRGCDDDHIGLHADYLWQNNLIHDKVTLDWHIGVGARVWFLDNDRYDDDRRNGTVGIGPRMPVGLDLMFQNPSFLEVYFELAPVLYITPFVDLDVESVLGVRFYF